MANVEGFGATPDMVILLLSKGAHIHATNKVFLEPLRYASADLIGKLRASAPLGARSEVTFSQGTGQRTTRVSAVQGVCTEAHVCHPPSLPPSLAEDRRSVDPARLHKTRGGCRVSPGRPTRPRT